MLDIVNVKLYIHICSMWKFLIFLTVTVVLSLDRVSFIRTGFKNFVEVNFQTGKILTRTAEG